MRIVYCIDSLASSGGTERVLTTKLNWWANCEEAEVAVVSLKEDKPPFFKIDPLVNNITLDVKPGDKKRYRTAIANIADTIKPDVMVAVAGMAVEALPLLKDSSKKVLEFHYTKNFLVNFVKGLKDIRLRQLHILKMRYLQWKLARTARKYDLFVGLTRRDVGLWGNPDNMTFVHNPLSFRSKRKSTCANKRIISVGSWTPAKGMDQLLEAFGPIARDYPDWTIELYGSGQDEGLLKSIISRYDMGRQVCLHRPVKDIENKLIEASIYAFPSRSDGFGLVITEAMECGLPTVAMDCPCGPCEILTPETGIVVPEGDIESFRTVLKRLMDSQSEREAMGRAASREVRRFYPDEIMPKWQRLFTSLCK